MDNFSLQAREGSYEPQAGWTESSISAKEIVTKKVYLSEQVLLDAQDIQSMTRGLEENGRGDIVLPPQRRSRCKTEDRTEAMIGRSMAIILNGKVLTLPKVSSASAETSKSPALSRRRLIRLSMRSIAIRSATIGFACRAFVSRRRRDRAFCTAAAHAGSAAQRFGDLSQQFPGKHDFATPAANDRADLGHCALIGAAAQRAAGLAVGG